MIKLTWERMGDLLEFGFRGQIFIRNPGIQLEARLCGAHFRFSIRAR